MQFTFWQSASPVVVPGKGRVPGRFASDAFDNAVGSYVVVNVGEVTLAGVLVSAEVAEDGRGVSLTVATSPQEPA